MRKASAGTFPKELLEASVDEKVAYFHHSKIDHPTIHRAKEAILRAITAPGREKLIFAYGPTGVGKTTLMISIMETIITDLLVELQSDLGRIPAVGMELPTPASSIFNWSETLQRLLRTMGDPLVDFKVPARTEFVDLTIPFAQRMNVARYRQAYEGAIKNRRPLAILLDDAQYLNKVPAARLLNQLEFIKSIAHSVQVPHVLLGTYELLTLRNLSGQMSRRSTDIHFPRYNSENAVDYSAFTKAAKSLIVEMPFEEVPDLFKEIDYLMERSAGCIGILKTWLENALLEALSAGDKTLTKKHLENQSYSNDALTRIFMELADGEARLRDSGSEYEIQLKRLREEAGNKPEAKPASNTVPGVAKAEAKRKNGRRRPGERNPCRDRIGPEARMLSATG